jgi:hypothetical protein
VTIKTFFTILAVLGLIHGIGFVLVPEQVASGYGMATSPSSVLTARLFGGALLAWGAIIWFAKDFRDEAAVRGVLIATVIADIVSLVVVVMGTLSGTMNALGWFAALIYLFSTAGSVYFLMTPAPQLSTR